MNILVFLPRFPYPLNKGDKLRAFNQIKELSKKHSIYLFALSDGKIKDSQYNAVKKYCKDIHVEKLSLAGRFASLLKCLVSKLPLQVALFTTAKAKNQFCKYFNTVKPDSVYFQFVRSGEYAKEIRKKCGNTETRLVLDFQDCLSMNMFRRAEVSSYIAKSLFLQETKRLRDYEDSMFGVFDGFCIITKEDKSCIMSQQRRQIKVVENGVSIPYLKPANDGKKTLKKEFDVLFSGNMSYKPNIVAAQFLVNDIMPLVWKKNKDVKVCLAGSNPVKAVKKLACDRVTVTGWVEDMNEYYAKSTVFVAPMQIGTGLQNKLLEAMAMMLPCVTTPLANCALKTEDGVHILVGTQAKEIAQHICNLLKNPSDRFNIAKQGNAFVKENYSWQTSVYKLEKLLTKSDRRIHRENNTPSE